MTPFGERVRALRAQRGLTLKRMSADRFDSMNVEDLEWLRELDLSRCSITAEDLRHLAALPKLAKLSLAGSVHAAPQDSHEAPAIG